MSETAKIGIGKEAQSLNISPQFETYSGVEIVVDENTSYLAGNDINRILRIENPWGTQAQADNILAALQAKAFQYQPYTASGAILNPAAEIGDGVTVSDVYSGVYKMGRTFSTLMTANIEAPQDEEVDHEYPFESKEQRTSNRRFSAIESEFSIQSNEIAAKVSETGGDNSSVSWSLTKDAWTVKANGNEVFRIDSSGASVVGKIRATSGEIGGFSIGATSIYSGTDSLNATGNGVYVGTDGISVGGGKFKVTSDGFVSAANMTLTGKLNIGGTNITAEALRSGAQNAYNWANTNLGDGVTRVAQWNNGYTYGSSYNNATQQNTKSYPTYFTASYIYALTYLSAASLSVTGNASIGKTLTVGGNSLGRLELTVYTNMGYQTKTFWVS